MYEEQILEDFWNYSEIMPFILIFICQGNGVLMLRKFFFLPLSDIYSLLL